MKKITILLAIAIISLGLVGCSDQSSDSHKSKHHSDNKHHSIHNTKIPKKIFSKTDKDKDISKPTMKKDIKLYLDSDRKLTDALEPYQDKISSEKKLSKKQLNKFKHIVNLQHKNNHRFDEYINNNSLPNHKYELYTKKINDYTAHVDQLYKKELNIAKEGNSVKKASKLADTDKNVNGKEQKQIEDFLKEEDIKTIAYDK